MSNTTLTADIVAKSALPILENELGWVNQLYRAPEEEFSKSVNCYKVGDDISIRRPADFTVRTGPTLSTQDVIEGKTTLKVDQQIGVDFEFSSTDLTLKIEDLAERVMKPAMMSIVNHIAADCASQMYSGFYNWVGTPGQIVNSYADFARGPERLTEMSVPYDGRIALLAPSDNWGLIGSQTNLFNGGLVSSAYTDGRLGKVGGCETFESQVAPSHTTGTRDNTSPLVNGADQNVTYDTAKNTWSQSLICDGFDASSTVKKGDVFTIAGVYMVNQRTKASTGILQQFVATADGTATAGALTMTISPPIIIAGPHQTVDAKPADNAALTFVGDPSTTYKQSMAFHKNAMALACVPMELPAAAYGSARRSYKGFSVRVIPIYDGTNDISKWRLDMLYGRKLIDPRTGLRLSGTA